MSIEGEIAVENRGASSRALGPWQLIALGIGAIIGAGIFVMTGHAAARLRRAGIGHLVHRREDRLLLRGPVLYAGFAR